jgi:HD-GYP domain-containing protein (c-di-GMP phosphodiesterase class II)
MAVVDVYDALMENRVYRKGIGFIPACNIIFDNERTQFDPVIVNAFRNIQNQIMEAAGI